MGERLKHSHCENCFAEDENLVVEAVAAVVDDAAADILEILALAELAFAAAVEDTYAVADVGVGLHNWYKLDFVDDGPAVDN